MNLIKVAARGPSPWASKPVSQQTWAPLSRPGRLASCPNSPPTCSVTLATYVPSEYQSGLQTLLRASVEL